MHFEIFLFLIIFFLQLLRIYRCYVLYKTLIYTFLMFLVTNLQKITSKKNIFNYFFLLKKASELLNYLSLEDLNIFCG